MIEMPLAKLISTQEFCMNFRLWLDSVRFERELRNAFESSHFIFSVVLIVACLP